MRRSLLAITVVLLLAGAGWPRRTQGATAAIPVRDLVEVRSPVQPAAGRSYEGRIRDVRPAWDILDLTVGEGKEARDMRFDIGYARIVDPDGEELKGQDLKIGARVRVQLTADGKTVQQVSVLAN